MVILNPVKVEFDGWIAPDVKSIVIDRAASKVVMEWTEPGPHVAFVDATRQVVTFRITIGLGPRVDDDQSGRTLSLPVALGARAGLVIVTSLGRSDGGRGRLEAQVVITSIRHDLPPGKPPMCLIEAVAVSDDGAVDPVLCVTE